MKRPDFISSLQNRFERFHRDERGEGVLTMLMVVAVGALIMAIVLKYGKDEVVTKVKELVEAVIKPAG